MHNIKNMTEEEMQNAFYNDVVFPHILEESNISEEEIEVMLEKYTAIFEEYAKHRDPKLLIYFANGLSSEAEKKLFYTLGGLLYSRSLRREAKKEQRFSIRSNDEK
jgi:hypothetical protein